MRIFLSLAYNGSHYCGWQKQPNATTVQETLEKALSTILRHPVDVTGCGRTDTGVHASEYVAHFDTENALPPTFINGINSLLPRDIAVFSAKEMADTAHARFDAYERAYEYHLSVRKDPFGEGLVWFYPQAHKLNREKMQEAADLLPQFNEFFPFCKTHSGVDHYRCDLREARWEWQPEAHKMIFHITANRFLRGMVRLIVGSCIQAGTGQLAVADIRTSLEKQTPLPKNLSVPPDGLYLTRVVYPASSSFE